MDYKKRITEILISAGYPPKSVFVVPGQPYNGVIVWVIQDTPRWASMNGLDRQIQVQEAIDKATKGGPDDPTDGSPTERDEINKRITLIQAYTWAELARDYGKTSLYDQFRDAAARINADIAEAAWPNNPPTPQDKTMTTQPPPQRTETRELGIRGSAIQLPTPPIDDRKYVWLARTPRGDEDPAYFKFPPGMVPDESYAIYLHRADAEAVDKYPTRVPIYEQAPTITDRARWNKAKTRERALAKLTDDERAELGIP